MSEYLVYALWEGNDEYNSTSSNYLLMTFNNREYFITLSSNYSNIQPGASVQIEGIVTEIVDNSINNTDIQNSITLTETSPSGTVTEYSIDNYDLNTHIFTKTVTLPESGVYTYSASIPSGTNNKGGKSNTITVNTDKINTTTSLSASSTSIYVDKTITLTAALRDAKGNRVTGAPVTFYYTTTGNNTYTKISTVKTNIQGNAIISYTPSQVSTYTFKAEFEGQSSYIASEKIMTVTTKQHLLDFSLNQSVVYPNYFISGRLFNEDKQLVNNKKLTVSFQDSNGNTIFSNYTGYTNREGYINTSTYKFTGNTVNIKVQYTATTGDKYKSFTKIFTIPVLTNESVTNTTLTGVNTSTNIPYRTWNNLTNILTLNNSYARCGGRSGHPLELIAGAAGSRKIPAPIKLTNFGFDIPDDCIIREVTVSINMRSLCSGIGTKLKIPLPTINLNGITSQKMTGSDYIPDKTFQTFNTTFTGLSIPSSTINKSTFNILTTFEANQQYDTGAVEIDQIKITVKYIPNQGDE
ncbi:Ig-like domain-containing protein [Methanosphaera sp.]|jgi:hypothetical protein|uniref:Ig-like domain-containing protein n=1 Tax=Methanosphaera sp. TaxID=2666342 RepID=UPI003D91BCB7